MANIGNGDQLLAEGFMGIVVLEGLIDKALDERDEYAFMVLSEKFNDLQDLMESEAVE